MLFFKNFLASERFNLFKWFISIDAGFGTLEITILFVAF